MKQAFTSLDSSSKWRYPWAVLLAGGDGTRLQSLTLKIAGDLRPKQFCCIFGGKTLLSQTRERLNPLFRRDRRLFVVTRSHEAFYREDLRNADDSCIIAQPQNRGTSVAIAVALFRILQREADALVAFFPCDHYYSNAEAFVLAVNSATIYARQHSDSIVLLGAEAHYPEVEYGWIEPGRVLSEASTVPLLRVNRFWEKPSFPEARALFQRGCLWNTFVSIGKARTFLELLCIQLPDMIQCIAKALTDNNLDFAYHRIGAADFSRDVLAPQSHRLLVVRDTGSGWADFGNPVRVIDTLARNRLRPAWVR